MIFETPTDLCNALTRSAFRPPRPSVLAQGTLNHVTAASLLRHWPSCATPRSHVAGK